MAGLRVNLTLAALIALTLSAAPGLAVAQPVTVPDTWGGDFWSRPRVTGSWGGVRDEVGKKGVVLDVDLLLMPQGVLSGGRDTDGGFWGSADDTLNVDTGKLGLWPGGFLRVYATTTFGENVAKDSGALVPVNTAFLFPEPSEPSTGLMNATFMQFLSTKLGSWKILLPGYAPEYVYSMGRLDRSLPFEELKRRGHINALAQAADNAPDFSRRIRAGLP